MSEAIVSEIECRPPSASEVPTGLRANTLRSLLVHLDGSPGDAERLRLGRELARVNEAELTALFAVTHPAVDLHERSCPEPRGRDCLVDRFQARRDAAARAFGAVSDRATWEEVGAEPLVAAVAERARYADLIVMGQPDPAHGAGCLPPILSDVLLVCGRPMLVVPCRSGTMPGASRIMLGWNASPEATRALVASLPLLQRAREVHVVQWSETPDRAQPDCGRLKAYLRLHGIDARMHVRLGHPEKLGQRLLADAEALEVDLLVSGCYGHRRYGDWVFDGRSHDLLLRSRIPLLVSH